MPFSTQSLTVLMNAAGKNVQMPDGKDVETSSVGMAVANLTLHLIEELEALHPKVASPVLTGFLHFVTTKKVSGVEADALILSGLVETNAESPTLTAKGKELLNLVSNLQFHDEEDATDHSHFAPSYPIQPFAVFVVGDRTFEVADGKNEGDLVFRLQGSDAWKPLTSTLEEGWDFVGAEMLRKSGDTVLQYMQMHVLHQNEASVQEGLHSFEIDDVSWWLRLEGKECQIRLGSDGRWLSVPSHVRADTLRNLGVLAAREVLPNIEADLFENMSEWLRRMAHASSVRPVMSFAS